MGDNLGKCLCVLLNSQNPCFNYCACVHGQPRYVTFKAVWSKSEFRLEMEIYVAGRKLSRYVSFVCMRMASRDMSLSKQSLVSEISIKKELKFKSYEPILPNNSQKHDMSVLIKKTNKKLKK